MGTRMRHTGWAVFLWLAAALGVGGCGAASRGMGAPPPPPVVMSASSESTAGDYAGGYEGGEAAPTMEAAPPPPAAATGGVVPGAMTTTTATVTVTTVVEGGMPRAYEPQVRRHALLTANAVGDVDSFQEYLGFLSRHPNEYRFIGLDTSRRVRVHVVDHLGQPVNDARIGIAGCPTPVAGRTHADGYWDFVPGVTAPGCYGQVSLVVAAGSQQVQAGIQIPQMGDGVAVEVRMPGAAAGAPTALELGFLIDVTGSMEDELRYVNREVGNIVQRVSQAAPGVQIRVGATFYRDRGDSQVVQAIPFTGDVNGFAQAMEGVRASGGGDYPEDMNAGLEAAMGRMQWAEGNVVRMMVLIADAPPQQYATHYSYREALRDASARGVRILPVAASGADRNVEMLFRAMGVVTSTPYVHLTDDSGIGGAHLDADTGRISVEYFNDLLTRLIVSDLAGRGTHSADYVAQNGPQARPWIALQ